MVTNSLNRLPLVGWLLLTCFVGASRIGYGGSAQGAAEPAKLAAVPKVLVAVTLREPDFTILEMKYRVFYNKSEVKKLPLTDYDFKLAFTDELINALSEDTRAEYVPATGDEGIDVMAVYDKKAVVPATVTADRLLLVDVIQYGALVADLGADKFTLQARFKLVDQTGKKKLWEKKCNERLDLPGKVSELQAENQKGLKDGINKLIEQICKKVRLEIKTARF